MSRRESDLLHRNASGLLRRSGAGLLHCVRRVYRSAARNLAAAHQRKVSRQSGIALVVVTVTVAILGAVVGEFNYNARVEYEAAANARDQLRAEYLARSAINLTRLLIKVQQSVLDRNRQFVGDVQLTDFAPMLMGAFGGSDDERGGLGALIGVSASSIKGLGVGKDATFEVAIQAEDGKININCGGGLLGSSAAIGDNGSNIQANQPGGGASASSSSGTAAPINTPAQKLYALLTALFFPPRYNRLFDNPDADGQYTTRDQLARAIIDWSDADEQRFEPLGQSGGAEDYRYDALADPYRAHNHKFDSVEELNLVAGVTDDMYGSFAPMFTTYGKCPVNLGAIKPDNWPIAAAIIRAAAKNPQDPNLLDDVKVAALAQQIGSMASLLGGVQSTDQFADMAKSGGVPQIPQQLKDAMGGAAATQQLSGLQGLTGIELDPGRLKALATTGPRTVYRIDATGSVDRPGGKKIQTHIRAIFDTQHFNQNTTSIDPNDRQGTWVYWRME